MDLERLLREFGQLFSSELGIDLSNEFEWLIASILFGNRISTEIAKRTFFAYRRAGLTTPWRIDQASWQDLVRVHGEGGYVRYDGITATYMKETAAKVIREHGARWAIIGAVLAAWAVKVPMIPMEIGMLGWGFSIARVALVAIAAIPMGLLLEWVMEIRVRKDEAVEAEDMSA